MSKAQFLIINLSKLSNEASDPSTYVYIICILNFEEIAYSKSINISINVGKFLDYFIVRLQAVFINLGQKNLIFSH